ncbi:rna exonuclease 4 [Phtheirospermum japonicum]|uniref:Rna exonuclease 4 n=1 Tax=Phtheirospermum japonicum TaxID=374723 RepID=A0A830CPP7_9LAMI|nr:rna exonuclease 4 [Phtheirospermum japonicum]
MPCTESQIYDPPVNSENGDLSRHPKAVALDCEMVGGGSDGSLDLCARVCLIDEDEKPIFHTYVQPQIPVTDYRYEVTGITEDHMRDAMPLEEVEEKILEILCNGESIGILRLNGGRARVLVGHGIEHDLDRLRMNYPDHMLRYEIQLGMHDPYEDCVSVMRLYKRLRSEKHPTKGVDLSLAARGLMNGFDSLNYKEIENMTPDELLDISKSNYKCWCLD